MDPVTISVRGSSAESIAPEEAVVQLELTCTGDDVGAAFNTLLEVRTPVTDRLKQLQESGHLDSWYAEQIHTTSERDWLPDGGRSEPVHRASMPMTVVFSDFTSLGSWVTDIGAVPQARINHVEWRLREQTARAADRNRRTDAVIDARTRAQDYADALGLGPVVVQSVNDPGVRAQPMAGVRMAKAMMADAGGAEGVEFSPQPVEVSAYVEATFVAGGLTT